ncbi:disintegrin and metalloproteinase domain-containing protein 10 isoform X2 [Coccinella septempunctata]|uniref:disintegrin and metalloproteinase domain-containing protein 10 isoform X2 n=1 Tax=Coccinella septempunctata TaxID=41139 RepID=UPI001D075E59|nr:disintegrin and metalloproteinase domain-containing protein 10 isoform X2 [Coccinella septempunctata]
MFSECVFVLFLITIPQYIHSANRLSEYISHYEPLDYDTKEVQRMHSRARRSISDNNLVHVEFKAHSRFFRLRLKRDLRVFGDSLEVHGENGKIDVDTGHIYHGNLVGEPQTDVFGSVINGVFEGSIITPKGRFFVEKAHHYFPISKHPNRTFHSVIYHEDHMNDPYEHLHKGHSPGCGINRDVLQWMHNIQNSAEDPEVIPSKPSNKHLDLKNLITPPSQKKLKEQFIPPPDPYVNEEDVFNKYSKEANTAEHNRHKRATGRDFNKNTCSLYIQTDPLIWRHIREQFPEHADPRKEHEVNEKTREEILSLIAHHVTAVNYIYRDTKFDGRNEHRNIKFEVQRIKIDDDSSCRCTMCGDMNQFCMENIDVSNFLNIHSLGNHEDFCLAYVFTYRDFTGGTLGLAWVASASGASGGICEKYKTYTETIGGMYQSTKRSLNTGIITFVNYNSRVPPKVSQLTLAHEIGHNFGSPHDYPPECRPGGLNGNFIMFASATSGDRPNNSKFSTCSISNISQVLDAIEDNKKRNCFTSSAGAFCGNKIVEAGEECDCGYDENECQDKCCYPRTLSIEDRRNSTAKGCQRRAGTQCSPSQGPCCSSETCKFVPFYQNEVCKPRSDCSMPSKCNGRSAECPKPQPLPDKTRCNNNTQLCIKGECSGSICLEWNLQPCSLTSQGHPDVDKRKLCELACQNGTDICRSTSEFADKVGLPKGGISLRPGSPCDNFQGYCDVFLKCRAVDADGPLVRLMNLLLNRDTLVSVAQWVSEHWWLCVLMSIGFIIFMGVFIKCCAVHTPSSNPKKPAARRIGDTLRRPMNTLRRMRHGGGHGGVHGQSRSRSRGERSRPSASQGPRPGYGEGRGHHYAPKEYSRLATAPPANYSRQTHPELYPEAYEMRHKV